jgi:alpha(1,3/1,4) fucosyltransferase
MKRYLLSLTFIFPVLCHAEFSDHIKRDIGEKSVKNPLRNIDFIYLINLDKRPEKFKNCISQLQPFGLIPHRFSAIYGWDLSLKAKNELGVMFSSEMNHDEWVSYYPLNKMGEPELEFLRPDLYARCVYSPWMTPGAIGCYLSHLSVLQDAYDSGYETIWIMEDDVSVESDPALLDTYVDKLDAEIGKGNWDILYTDMDTADAPMYGQVNDFVSDLKGDLFYFWRPDVDLSEHKRFAKRKVVNDDFVEIGSRMRTHSMIIRKSGIKKILEYIKKQHIFLPYDHEIAIVPNIHMFNIRSNIVTFAEEISDTKKCDFNQSVSWDQCKQRIKVELPKIPGWYDINRCEKLINFIYEKKPKLCVEIGAFAGSTTFQIAKTLEFLDSGFLYAVDAWDKDLGIKGIKDEEVAKWWGNLNISKVKDLCEQLILNNNLSRYCELIHQTSKQAASSFQNETIDFLYIDGNSSGKGALEDVHSYFSKVKIGGHICIQNTDLKEKNKAISFLMKHCDWLKEESFGVNLLMFQKKTNTKNELLEKVDLIANFDVKDFYVFQDECKEQGVDLSVRDTLPAISEVFSHLTKNNKVIIFNLLINKETLAKIPKKDLVYFLWEPWAVPVEYYESFGRVYTWNDDLIDNKKFFKIHYPSLLPMEDILVPFQEKKFCVMVSGSDLDPEGGANNIHDLYSERMRMVEFFETKPKNELEIYGRNWKKREYRDYIGEIPGFHSGKEKILTLKKYRFSICFENTKNVNGYVTEKIFCCFAAGCIPIYWGASNVEQYIPKQCFIDYRDFQDKEELYSFMKNMTEEDYNRYIINIRDFLKSEKAQVFSATNFKKYFLDIVKK